MSARNGYIKKSLELPRQLSPQDAETLRLGWGEVLRGLAESDKERAQLEASLAHGWEERPTDSRLYDRLALRVEHEEDRRVLARAERFRRFLSEPLPEAPVDPQLEQLILDQAAKRAAASAAAEAVLRQLTSGLVELSKRQQRDPKADHAVLRAQVAQLREAVQEARDVEDRALGRVAQLLSIREARRRSFALAASITK